jgi:hypothetical protein
MPTGIFPAGFLDECFQFFQVHIPFKGQVTLGVRGFGYGQVNRVGTQGQ